MRTGPGAARGVAPWILPPPGTNGFIASWGAMLAGVTPGTD